MKMKTGMECQATRGLSYKERSAVLHNVYHPDGEYWFVVTLITPVKNAPHDLATREFTFPAGTHFKDIRPLMYSIYLPRKQREAAIKDFVED